MNNVQQLKNRIINDLCQLNDINPNQALALTTRLFVELGIESVDLVSGNKEQDIQIGPMLGRSITIHKPKKPRNNSTS